MPLQLALVKDNFHELTHALKYCAGESVHLTANYWGSRIYDAGRGWGKLWTWFYDLLSFFGRPGEQFAKLKLALQNTHILFEKHLPLIIEQSEKYRKYLNQSFCGYELREKDFFETRKIITDWNRATAQFVKFSQFNGKERLAPLFATCFERKTPKEREALFQYSAFQSLKRQQKIIDLEGGFNGPLPLALLEKVYFGKKLNDSDIKELKQWIKQLNQSSCSVHQLHRGLKAIIEELHKDDRKCDVEILEVRLEELGCTVFNRPDPKTLAWRNQIHKGTVIDSEFIIGEQIGQKVFGFDSFLVFNISNYNDLVMIFGHNESILGIRRKKHDVNQGFGVEPAQFLGLSPNGRWAIMEKLQPLDSVRWNSQDSISWSDRRKLGQVVKLLKWLIEQGYTPKNFTHHTLMLDRNQKLKSLLPTARGEFDFNAMEDFIFRYSNNHLPVYQYLMNESGLALHPNAEFYHEIVEHTLKGETIDLDDLGGVFNITDPQVVDRAKTLQTDILQIRRQICLQLLKYDSSIDSQSIQKKINEILLAQYRSNRSASILWPTLYEQVLQRLQALD